VEIYIPVYRLSESGGVERYTWQVGLELATRGHLVTFVAPTPSTPIPHGSRLIPVRSLGSKHTLSHLANLVTFGVRGTIRARHRPAGSVVYRPLGGSFGAGVVTAHSCHAAWLRDRNAVLGRRRPTVLDRILLAQESLTFRDRSTTLTTVSKTCAADIASFYGVPNQSIGIAPPAINSTEFRVRSSDERLEARESLGVADDHLVVGIVANHAFTRKRVDLAIAAAARNDATLLVAGLPDVHENIHRRQARDLGADVRFLGVVQDMVGFYRALDVSVLPSVYESYGMAAHEAMATGVATIVSKSCGVASLFEGGEALLTTRGDVDELSDRIGALRDVEARASLAAAGAEWAHRRSWSDVVDELFPSLEAAAAASSERSFPSR